MTDNFEVKDCPECEGTGKVNKRTKAGVARRSRNKGNKAEMEVAKLIAKAIGVPYEECRRTPNSGALVERGDLRLSRRAVELFPWFIEVKNREGWDFWQVFSTTDWCPEVWYYEAEDKAKHDARTGFGKSEAYPVLLVLRQNRKRLLACFRTELVTNAKLLALSPTIEVNGFCFVDFEDFLECYMVSA